MVTRPPGDTDPAEVLVTNLIRFAKVAGRELPARPALERIASESLEAMQDRVARFVRGAATGVSTCRAPGCGARIYWIRTAAGGRAPYDQDAKSHFATCPGATAFRGRGGTVA